MIETLRDVFQPGRNSLSSRDLARTTEIRNQLLCIAREDPNRDSLWTLDPAMFFNSNDCVFESKFGFPPFLPTNDAMPVCEMDYPLNARRTMSHLVRSSLPDLEMSLHEEEKRNAAARSWWLGLNESTRQALYKEYYRPTSPDDPSDTTTIAVDILADILTNDHYKKFMENRMLIELDADVKAACLAEIFQTKSRAYIDAIAREYANVYDAEHPRRDAKLLLEIFLQVPRTSKKTKSDFSEKHFRALPSAMEAALNRWNDLATSAKNDETILRDPHTLLELERIASKFADPRHCHSGVYEPGEFIVGNMVYTFMEYCLSTDYDTVPEYLDLRRRAIRANQRFEKMDETGVPIFSSQDNLQQLLIEWNDIVGEYRAFRDYMHAREHAMLALVPLLPYLSPADSRKLIYAVFSHQFSDDRRFSFSGSHFGQHTFQFHAIPFREISNIADTFKDVSPAIEDQSLRYTGHGIEDRLFGLALPQNIVRAMVDFLVESLYLGKNPKDVNMMKCQNAFTVLPYLIRYIDEDPINSSLVFNGFEQVIENAITIPGLIEEELDRESRSVYTRVIVTMLSTCITTRAVTLANSIKKIYQGKPFTALTRNILTLDIMLQKICASDENNDYKK